ncbi:hypothetical protein [Mycobacterium sp. PSTR-4-N]|uniref:hypothetical protein n=1 Tax=Mycobacterium sp. PSTR-4-N TaxID=2917745 RepID=UPI001F154E7A|nr:hypothetical protein [Mycobacterium sp. PSTR-4-N]MCG7595761.1 hypothetical protein [Mycobacterium sp. PSTR-4-N]
MRLFLSGHSYRDIGLHPKVKLSAKGVGNVVHRYLAEANPNHNTLGQQASVVYLERLEQMLRAVWPQAVRGDLKAVSAALRILAQEARFHSLDASAPGVSVLADAGPLDVYRQRGGS